ncbi:hypothetical protein F5883DRAFT_716106 [Diaporthe sp. PMI_573]|nr:hypothetical protein F5883DRAFT_716106 [Diaporthaceae sp. PMI_573]
MSGPQAPTSKDTSLRPDESQNKFRQDPSVMPSPSASMTGRAKRAMTPGLEIHKAEALALEQSPLDTYSSTSSDFSREIYRAALLAILACTIIVYITPHLPANVVDTALRYWNAVALGRYSGGGGTRSDVSLFVTTQHITLPIDDQINSIIDLYTPFLCPDTPLLKLEPDTFSLVDEDMGTTRATLVSPEDNADEWHLPLTIKRVAEICFSRLMRGSDLHSDPAQVCTALQERLSIARERHHRVAQYLASPHTIVLWLHKVRWRFLRLFYALEDMSAEPEMAAAGAAADEEKQRTADLLYRHVGEGAPWHSLNKEIRETLLQLRQDFVSIAGNLVVLYSHYDRAITSLPQQEGRQPSAVGLFVPEHVPVAHMRLMISAIDGDVAALDAVDDGLLQLRTLLAATASAGWKTEELIDGARVTVLFGLPAPRAILRSVNERLEKMMADASELQETWSLSKKASSGV